MPPATPTALVLRDVDPFQGLTVVTTTIFVSTSATGDVLSGSGGTRIPVGAIVGGLLGGILIACAAVGGWIWWGKVIERKARKDQPAIRSALKNDPYRRSRTASANGSLGSAHASRRSLQRTPPPMGAISQKSVTFADEETGNIEPKGGTGTGTPSPSGSLRSEERGRTPPRSAMRSVPATMPPTRRSHSSERAYVPARPSPLAQTSSRAGPPPTRRATGRRSPAMSMRSPSPAAMYSRSPTPTGQSYAGSGGALLNAKPKSALRTRRNSAPPAPPSPQMRAAGTGTGTGTGTGLTTHLVNPKPQASTTVPVAPAAVSSPALNIISPSQTSLVSPPTTPPATMSRTPSTSTPSRPKRYHLPTNPPPQIHIPPVPSSPPPAPPTVLTSTGQPQPRLAPPPAAMNTSISRLSAGTFQEARSSVSMGTLPSVYSQEGTALDIEPVRPPVDESELKPPPRTFR